MREWDMNPALSALCVGYEQQRWRALELAHHLFDYLPEFALSWSEVSSFDAGTGRTLMRRAARAVYDTPKYQSRGEFGELLLHAVLRQVFQSEPAVSKIFFKDGPNDTVKGFDSVHVVVPPEGDADLELWLGEVKFYNNLGSAITAVVPELADHLDADYMRREFAFVGNKVDPNWPHAARFKRLIHENTSLDRVFKTLVVPVLLTYDSGCVCDHTSVDDPYPEKFAEEVLAGLWRFASKPLPVNVRIHLLLAPLHSKEALVAILNDKLATWQNL